MSKYRPVYTKIWKDKDFLGLVKDAKLLFLYFITNESITNSGIYEIPLKTISAETGIGLPTVDHMLSNGSIKNLVYDRENEIVFVTNARKYCRGGNPSQVEKGVVNEFKQTSKTFLWNLFLELNPCFKDIFSTVDQPLPNGTLPLPLPLVVNNNNRRNSEQEKLAKQVISHLNEKAHRNFKETDTSVSIIVGRLKDGYALDDCKRVVDVKVGQWLGDEKMDKYLRPQTLFNKEKFDGYLNEKLDVKKKQKLNPKLEIIKNWGEKHGRENVPARDSNLIDVGTKN
jgi:uncharacterized phage protein (TIGR02220 family)